VILTLRGILGSFLLLSSDDVGTGVGYKARVIELVDDGAPSRPGPRGFPVTAMDHSLQILRCLIPLSQDMFYLDKAQPESPSIRI